MSIYVSILTCFETISDSIVYGYSLTRNESLVYHTSIQDICFCVSFFDIIVYLSNCSRKGWLLAIPNIPNTK